MSAQECGRHSRVVLTGGMGAGKSTVGRRWADLGAVVIDYDQLARDVVAPGSRALDQIAAVWPDVVGSRGLNRAALARIVFADPRERDHLEAITHPAIREAAARREAAAVWPTDGPGRGLVAHEIPLYAEGGGGGNFDAVVTVEAPEDVRVRRLVEHRGLDEAEARARIATQASAAQRCAYATHVLDASVPLAELLRATDALLAELMGG
ncbi:MAG: dephospho-CoA kinase [Bowdeniella nasicola]|nr:dephospho-CoA kinase [Bowdeniella nasicola]